MHRDIRDEKGETGQVEYFIRHGAFPARVADRLIAGIQSDEKGSAGEAAEAFCLLGDLFYMSETEGVTDCARLQAAITAAVEHLEKTKDTFDATGRNAAIFLSRVASQAPSRLGQRLEEIFSSGSAYGKLCEDTSLELSALRGLVALGSYNADNISRIKALAYSRDQDDAVAAIELLGETALLGEDVLAEFEKLTGRREVVVRCALAVELLRFGLEEKKGGANTEEVERLFSGVTYLPFRESSFIALREAMAFERGEETKRALRKDPTLGKALESIQGPGAAGKDERKRTNVRKQGRNTPARRHADPHSEHHEPCTEEYRSMLESADKKLSARIFPSEEVAYLQNVWLERAHLGTETNKGICDSLRKIFVMALETDISCEDSLCSLIEFALYLRTNNLCRASAMELLIVAAPYAPSGHRELLGDEFRRGIDAGERRCLRGITLLGQETPEDLERVKRAILENPDDLQVCESQMHNLERIYEHGNLDRKELLGFFASLMPYRINNQIISTVLTLGRRDAQRELDIKEFRDFLVTHGGRAGTEAIEILILVEQGAGTQTAGESTEQ